MIDKSGGAIQFGCGSVRLLSVVCISGIPAAVPFVDVESAATATSTSTSISALLLGRRRHRHQQLAAVHVRTRSADDVGVESDRESAPPIAGEPTALSRSSAVRARVPVLAFPRVLRCRACRCRCQSATASARDPHVAPFEATSSLPRTSSTGEMIRPCNTIDTNSSAFAVRLAPLLHSQCQAAAQNWLHWQRFRGVQFSSARTRSDCKRRNICVAFISRFL